MTVGARAFLAAAEGTWAIPAPLASRKESSRAIHRAGVGRGILGQARRPPQRHKCRSLDKSGTYALFRSRDELAPAVSVLPRSAGTCSTRCRRGLFFRCRSKKPITFAV